MFRLMPTESKCSRSSFSIVKQIARVIPYGVKLRRGRVLYVGQQGFGVFLKKTNFNEKKLFTNLKMIPAHIIAKRQSFTSKLDHATGWRQDNFIAAFRCLRSIGRRNLSKAQPRVKRSQLLQLLKIPSYTFSPCMMLSRLSIGCWDSRRSLLIGHSISANAQSRVLTKFQWNCQCCSFNE